MLHGARSALQRNLSYFVLAGCGPMGPGTLQRNSSYFVLADCGPMGPGALQRCNEIMSHFVDLWLRGCLVTSLL